jgi:hypothetical protein
MSGKPSKETQRVERPRLDETLAPSRNFSISTADRVRAAAGPPAYSRRKRHIEDLQAALVRFVGEAIASGASHADAARQSALAVKADPRVAKLLREVNRLIAAHNRYYPIEANLPLDPATRLQLDHGRPWQPLPTITLEDVIAACGAAEHVGKMT